MTTVMAVHSHGGGTGKSHFAMNLAAVLATRGRRVCLVDTDVQAPGLHVLLGLTDDTLPSTLSDYLVGDCDIEQAAYDVTERLGPAATGRLVFVPSRLDAGIIARLVGRGYDVGLLDEGFRILTELFAPDLLLLDTHAGMTNETMVALTAADSVTLLMRADEQDVRGAAVTTAVTRRLNCPRTEIVVNMVAEGQDVDRVRGLVRAAYGCDVAAVVRYSPEIAALAGATVFVLAHPEHALTHGLARLGERLLGRARVPAPFAFPTH